MSKKVAVIMGSDSDLPIVKQAVQKLKEFNVPFEVHVMSAHRTPEDAAEFSKHAQENGFGVIISAAGKAAHLGGDFSSSYNASCNWNSNKIINLRRS